MIEREGERKKEREGKRKRSQARGECEEDAELYTRSNIAILQELQGKY